MPRKPALHALQLLTSQRWAIRREALERMVAIAERDLPSLLAMQDEDTDERAVIEKVTERRALFASPATAHPQSERIGVRDGVAIIPIVGPLCRYASWIQGVCGLTSYQLAAEDFQIAIADPSITAIMLHLDSPGGEVNGCSELASLIHAARGTKPIIAMVSDGAASAAYWIAAAADEIVVTPAAYVGSIGVYFEIVDWSEREKMEGMRRFQIVSSQSPNKVPDPKDAAGMAVLQREASEFADAFIVQAADCRGMTPDALVAAGDGGAVFIGRFAVERGLADRVSTTEAVLAELAAQGTVLSRSARADFLAAARTTHPEFMMAKSPKAATAAQDTGTTAFRLGDRVRVRKDMEHDEMTADAVGAVSLISTPALGIEFDGMDGVHRWYVDEELEAAPAAQAAPSNAEQDEDEMEMEMAARRRSATRIEAMYPDVVAFVRGEAVSEERRRIAALAALDPRQISPTLLAAISGGASEGETAKVLLAASRDAGAAHLAAITGAEASLTPPAPLPTGADAAPSAAKQITSLLDEVSGRGRARRSSTN